MGTQPGKAQQAAGIETLGRQRPTMVSKRRPESRDAVMRKREVIELRYRIDCAGWSCTSNGHQQGTAVKRGCENAPESKSTAYLTLICSAYPGDLSGSAISSREYRPMQW